MSVLGGWLGRWSGGWFGAAGEPDPNAMSGNASLRISAAGAIENGAVGFISGSSLMIFAAIGDLSSVGGGVVGYVVSIARRIGRR